MIGLFLIMEVRNNVYITPRDDSKLIFSLLILDYITSLVLF